MKGASAAGSIFGLCAILCVLALTAAQFPNSKVNIGYDKVKNSTEVSIPEMQIDNAIGRKKEKQDLRLEVRYLCAGNTSHCHPDEIDLTFVSDSSGEYERSHDLTLLVGGKKIRAKTTWVGGYAEGGAQIEQMKTFVTAEELMEIAHADEVEGKLGQTTFKLSGKNIGALRQLASEMS